jgi:polyisoprenoid-binding protein YceI
MAAATTTTTTVRVPPSGTYRVDPVTSTVHFTTRHLFGLARVKGSFAVVSGEVIIAQPALASTATAVIDAASFVTGNTRRDNDVKSATFLAVASHPRITFRSTELARDGATWRLRGHITARGTTAPVELTVVEATTTGQSLVLRATAKVDRYAHGISKVKGMAGRYLNLEITAFATRL